MRNITVEKHCYFATIALIAEIYHILEHSIKSKLATLDPNIRKNASDTTDTTTDTVDHTKDITNKREFLSRSDKLKLATETAKEITFLTTICASCFIAAPIVTAVGAIGGSIYLGRQKYKEYQKDKQNQTKIGTLDSPTSSTLSTENTPSKDTKIV